MKRLIIIAAFIIAISVQSEDLKTTNGKVYKDYEIETVTDKVITIAHEGGSAEIVISDLPDEVKNNIQDKIKDYKIKPKLKPDTVFKPQLAEKSITKTREATKPISAQEQRLLNAIKERENKIQELKKELKPILAEMKLKGTFKNSNNDNLVSDLKSQERDIKETISDLERQNNNDRMAIEQLAESKNTKRQRF